MQNNKVTISFLATKHFEEIDYYFKLVLRRAVVATLKHEGFDSDAEVSITLCDNEYIKKLNSEYRNKDTSTDVLSFPLYDFSMEDALIPGEAVPLGDIVISMERAKEQAKEIGNPFLKEVAFLTVHSMLHLLGYDHELGSEEEEAQCAAQREIIESFEI